MNQDKPHYPALILAGGLGTRLREVDSVRPKPMVLVGGEPFLYWLVKHLQDAGFKEFIFSTGYKSQFIRDFDWASRFRGLNFAFYDEVTALGTGGAVRAVFENWVTLPGAWVVNGDTLLTHPLPPGDVTTGTRGAAVYTALSSGQVFDAQPNLLTQDDVVLGVGPGGNCFDGGQVFVNRQAITQSMAQSPCSIHELLGPLFSRRQVSFKLVAGSCYDIGTPARLARFQKYIADTQTRST